MSPIRKTIVGRGHQSVGLKIETLLIRSVPVVSCVGWWRGRLCLFFTSDAVVLHLAVQSRGCDELTTVSVPIVLG